MLAPVIAATNWKAWGAIFAGISALAAVFGFLLTYLKFVLPRRGFHKAAEVDAALQTRVSFKLKGETPHSIQDVHLATRRSWLYRLIHDQSRVRARSPTTITARAVAANPALPVEVRDKNARVFVFDVLDESVLPPTRPTTKGWEKRLPTRKEIRVYVSIDAKQAFLLKPKLVDSYFA